MCCMGHVAGNGYGREYGSGYGMYLLIHLDQHNASLQIQLIYMHLVLISKVVAGFFFSLTFHLKCGCGLPPFSMHVHAIIQFLL